MLLEILQKHSRLSAAKLERYAETASRRYKVYEIPKKGGGSRLIEHPSREIKAIQRWLTKILISKFPVHDCATAYKDGASILINAEKHVRTNFTLRVDFENFFPSFSDVDVEFFLNSRSSLISSPLNRDDIVFFKRIVCRNGRLTIGAPSSPSLTNVMMHEFDYRLNLYCENEGLIFTRYADDIFVSAENQEPLRHALSKIEEIAAQHPFAKLAINKTKTAFLSRKYRRSITGIVITPQRRTSIGRKRKDEIRSGVYKYCLGKLPPEVISNLQGNVAFAKDSDPDFFKSLVRKYGEHQILRILKADDKHLPPPEVGLFL